MTRRDLRRRPRETSASSGPFALFMFDGLCRCDLVLLLSRFALVQDFFIVAKDLFIAAKCPACRKPSCGERDSRHNRAKRGAMELRRIRSLLAQSGLTERRVILPRACRWHRERVDETLMTQVDVAEIEMPQCRTADGP